MNRSGFCSSDFPGKFDKKPGESMVEKRISLGWRPSRCMRVQVLGVKLNLDDYEPWARKRIEQEDRILYPTSYWAKPLGDAGKSVFPSAGHYWYLGDKIRQTALFSALGISHPKTRVYPVRSAGRAYSEFTMPFVAKLPHLGQGRGVFLIHNEKDWAEYLALTRKAYIQEYFPIEEDLRVVVLAGHLVTAYRRRSSPGEFRTNVFQGGRIDFSDVPDEGVAFAVKVARLCGFDDVGLDVCRYRGRWWVLEANMHWGQEGLALAGISFAERLDHLIEQGVI